MPAVKLAGGCKQQSPALCYSRHPSVLVSATGVISRSFRLAYYDLLLVLRQFSLFLFGVNELMAYRAPRVEPTH